MYRASHLIQRQVLEIETPDAAAGLGFQQEVRDVFYQKLMPQLEKLFDEAVQKNQLISIEYLPVNIKIEDAKNWQDELVQKAVRQINQVLKESPKKTISSLQTSAQEHGENYSLTDDFFYFLEHGYLRWNASVQSLKDFEALLNTGQNDAVLSQRLLKILSENEHIIQRLCYQFSTQFIQALFVDELLRQTLGNWAMCFTGLKDAAFRLVYIKAWIRKESGSVFADDEQLLMQIVVENIAGTDAGDWYQRQPSPTQTFIRKILDQDFNTVIYPEKKDSKPMQENIIRKNNKQPEEENRSPANEVGEDSFYIDNAGLIITHVFFKNFFEATGLWQNKMFANEAAHQRAVLLTAYLVTEEAEFPEYNLLLNKILCGFPAEQSLPLTIAITGQEKMESVELLQTIIDSWKYNGRAVCTTIENLRSSFLKRNGKLTKKDNAWLLQVEQQGYDILLNGLQWRTGTIKLPWMENIFHVEWI